MRKKWKDLLCKIFGHNLQSTGKWRDYCPNVGLYKCKRCDGVTMVYPPLLDIANKMSVFPKEKYKYETYIT